ncbi:hypothetical protein [Collinsella stercoris]|uniref:hypothetical protein n=1 Tax=Collinsella stercoris TaxID=147206 RepID=UPI003A91F788
MTRGERREVAAKLRELVADWFDDGEFYDRGEVEDVLGLATDDGAWYEAAGVRRLADLIEPEERTCHMRDASWDAGQRTWGCICSECEAKYEHKRSRWMNFCPNCGAKVIQE